MPFFQRSPYNISAMAVAEEKLVVARRQMVASQLKGRGIDTPSVLEAFGAVPRERFLPREHRPEAYADLPVPIGQGQTISQPYIVALMVQALDPLPHHNVLDVGAGSGYQTAILARLARHVYALERIEEFTERAISVLGSLNVNNVTLCTRDGSLGWAAEAPFDRIICGAAAPDVPAAWIEQLADGGRIVVPVGGLEIQTLLVLDKRGDTVHRRELCEVRFVKLIGKQGWTSS